MEQDDLEPLQRVGLPEDEGAMAQRKFRYPRYVLTCMRWAIGCPLIFFAAMYYALVDVNTDMSLLLPLFVAPALTGTMFMWFVYMSMKKYGVQVTPSGIEVTYLFSKKIVSFSDMSEIQLLEGGRGYAELRLRNRSGKTITSVNNWVENYVPLTLLLKQDASRFGIRYLTPNRPWQKS